MSESRHSIQMVPVRIRADIPDQAAIGVIKTAAEMLGEKIMPMLTTKERCVGFLMGAERDGIKLAANWRDLDLESMKAVCIQAWWKRVERMLDVELEYVGEVEQ